MIAAANLFDLMNGAAQAVPFCVVEYACVPRGKGRPRGRIVRPRSGPMFINFYTDAETAAYEKAIAWKAAAAMRGKPPETGPLAARVYAMMPIPKSWPNRDKEAALAGIKFPMSASDCDNIAKSIFDGCNGIIYADDKQIVQMLVHKEYAENPGIIAEFFKLA